MTRILRLRRVAILCETFARNMAYYRAGRARRAEISTNFWLTTNGNCFDTCVLEFCKLFADAKDPHHWSAIVANRTEFEAALLRHIGTERDDFTAYRREMRWHRDKFVAHLDSEPVMHLPLLDNAKAATEFYHRRVIEDDLEPASNVGLVADLPAYYETCHREALETLERYLNGA